jgi:hypothetical protein
MGAASLIAGLWMGWVAAGPEHDHAAKAPPQALERFRALAGTWVSVEDGPMVKKGDVVAVYHVTGGGSAVVEELFPGMEHAMTTVYTMEGKDLVLTHYCMTGNQPRMRAKSVSASKVEFKFDGGANIDPKTTQHMHDATFEFVGPDEMKSTWVEFENGKSAMTVGMHIVRKNG